MGTVRPADLGDRVELPNYGGAVLTVGPRQPKCVGGYWVCITHAEAFEHNLAKDSHLDDDRDHALAWFCLDHGLEQP